MNVYVISLEYNFPRAEVCGDPGIEGVYVTEAEANTAALALRLDLESSGHEVYRLSNEEGRHCAFCGEANPVRPDGTFAACPSTSHPEEAGWCDCCGAELSDIGTCENDHDAWDLDVHVTAHRLRDHDEEDEQPAPVHLETVYSVTLGVVVALTGHPPHTRPAIHAGVMDRLQAGRYLEKIEIVDTMTNGQVVAVPRPLPE